LIKRYFTRQNCRAEILQGIGDDCAVVRIPTDRELALTIDTLVAGIHFLADCAPYNLGWKSLAVNLSDLAAMGAEPAWITLALTIPHADLSWLDNFQRGLFALADQYSVELIGGDTTRGPLTITIQAHGFIPHGQALRRSGARPGDLIYVTGTLGDAVIGLDLALGRNTLITSGDRDFFLERLELPTPRIAAGIALRNLATSAIDISDGLAADLGHILNASGSGAVIHLDWLPRSAALAKLKPPWEKIISGGDDYELCFTLPPERQNLLNAAQISARCEFTLIGEVTAAPEIIWLDSNSQVVPLNNSCFLHFS